MFFRPAAVILVLALLLRRVQPQGQRRLCVSWRDKFWIANASWLGLGLALSTTLFVTSGLKAMVGKPRPNFLDICNADVDHWLTLWSVVPEARVTLMRRRLVTCR